MTERPEFVPVFLQSATDIKEFLLSQIPGVRKSATFHMI